MAVTAEQFFETQHTPSQVKSAIASDYFEPWSRIMTKRARQSVIGYADLFAGRGRFRMVQNPLRCLSRARLSLNRDCVTR